MAGQIINRGKSVWLVRVFLGCHPETGKRKYHNKTIHGNKKDAEGALTDLQKSRNAGTLTIGSESLLVGDLLDDVIRDYRINGQDVTWAGLVMKRIRPTFGKLSISTIRPAHVNKHIESRQTGGAANATINHELSMLRRAFSLAIENGRLKVAPFKVPKLKENNVRKGFFEHGPYMALRDALPEELRLLLAFGYYTGCRRGELLKIQWPQIDLDEGIARLEPGETKNDDARMIPLAPELLAMLTFEKGRRDSEYPECPWVFSRHGERVRNFRKSWDAACQAAGLWDAEKKRPTKLFHDLRRTGVRNLVRSGTPESVAQRISGHKTRAVFDRYNITTESDLKAAAKRLGTYLQEKTKAVEGEREKMAAGTQSENWHTIGTQAGKRAS